MTDDSLLPSSATRSERTLARAMALDKRLTGVAGITGGKLGPTRAFIPWLLWEYALGEVLDYLPDPARALREGIAWQRLRGTPAGLRMAYSWRGWQDVTIEEGIVGTGRFAEFQIDPGIVLGHGGVDDLVGLSRLAAPARSRLARIFHGYDLRRLRLDHGRLGKALLSDYSGIHDPRGVRLSFGRTLQGEAERQSVDCGMGVTADHGTWVAFRNTFTFDASHLDRDRTLRFPVLQHQRELTQGNDIGVPDQADIRRRRFARAMVVLSEPHPLDAEVNCRTSPRWPVQQGERPRLSSRATRLSGYRSRVTYQPIYEVFAVRHGADAEYDGAIVADSRNTVRPIERHPTRRFPVLSQPGWYTEPAFGGVTYAYGGFAALSGQFWTGASWPADTWRDVREVVSATHTTTII